MTAKEYLRQYRQLFTEIEAKQNHIDELWAAATRCTSSTRPNSSFCSGGGTSDRVGNYSAKIADLSREIDMAVDTLVDLERDIRAKLAAVPIDRYRVLLELRYINGYTWERIAEAMHYDERQIRRLHGYALLFVKID